MNTNPDNGSLVEIDETNFESEVLRSKQPVTVAFLTPWSQPCQVFKSVLNEIAAACAGRIKIVTVNADNSLGLSLIYGIDAIPTLLFFVNGKICVRNIGTDSKEAILSKLKPFFPSI